MVLKLKPPKKKGNSINRKVYIIYNDMNVNNQKEFFENIQLDVDGNVIAVLVPSPTTPVEKGVNQYNTFKKIELTTEGYLKIYSA